MVWGDAATAVFHEATLARSSPPVGIGGAPAAVIPTAPSSTTRFLTTSSSSPVGGNGEGGARFSLPRRLVHGGLSLDPTSDWLWSAAGAVAGEEDLATREYCWSRALQLNPRRAGTWAALGRMYAQAGAGKGARRWSRLFFKPLISGIKHPDQLNI